MGYFNTIHTTVYKELGFISYHVSDRTLNVYFLKTKSKTHVFFKHEKPIVIDSNNIYIVTNGI